MIRKFERAVRQVPLELRGGIRLRFLLDGNDVEDVGLNNFPHRGYSAVSCDAISMRW